MRLSKTNKGKLIVIDGIDGSGKTVQTKMLSKTLRRYGYDFKIIDFPRYGEKSAGMAEQYLNGKYGALSPYQAAIFFAVDRFDAKQEIEQWLNAGKLVISNRYVTASAGHLGGKILKHPERIKFFKWLDQLEYEIFGMPKPDLNIILDLPAKTAQKLVGKKDQSRRKYLVGKKRDIHEKDLKHLQAAEKVFIEISKTFPNTQMVKCVEAGKLLSLKQIHEKIWNLVRQIAANSKVKRK